MHMRFTAVLAATALMGCSRASALTQPESQVAHCIAALNLAALIVERSGNSVVASQLRVRALYEGSKLQGSSAIDGVKAETVAFTKGPLTDSATADRVTADCLHQEDADPQFAIQAPRFVAQAAQLAGHQAQ